MFIEVNNLLDSQDEILKPASLNWEDGLHFGNVKDGKPYGPRIYTYADGGKNVGELKDGERNRKGR